MRLWHSFSFIIVLALLSACGVSTQGPQKIIPEQYVVQNMDRYYPSESPMRKQQPANEAEALSQLDDSLGAMHGQPQPQQPTPDTPPAPIEVSPFETPPDTIKVGLLLPLSGDSESIGKALQNAAELALFDISSKAARPISLMPFDTKGTTEGAMEATYLAIDGGAHVLLGPLFSHTTRAVLPIARANNMQVFSLSNNSDLAGSGAYALGFMPQQQIHRVLDFAHDRGIERFSALLPDNGYGIVASQQMEATLRQLGEDPVAREWYSGANVGLSKSITRVLAPVEATPEYARVEKSEGLLIPEGGRMLLSIIARLTRAGVDSSAFRFLGSGEWDDEAIAKEKDLIGSWFATSPPHQRRLFEENFRQVFGYKPVRVSSLAYDGVALITILAQAQDAGMFSHSRITNSQGFLGVNGVFRLRSDGLAERALAVIEITEDGFEIIDPAPTRF